MNSKVLIGAVAIVLAGGVAFAAYQRHQMENTAEVVAVVPVTQKVPIYADVVGVNPVTQTLEGPREVCEDQPVAYERQVKDPNRVTGTVAGAVVGGLIGSQVGSGSGKKAATAAGAVGGALAGREIQERRQAQQGGGGAEVRTERVCRTVTGTETRTIGYDVTYMLDGETRTMRTERKPGKRLTMGEKEEIVAYEVTYRYKDRVDTIRMTEEPGSRLPVENGQVVVAQAGSD